MTSTKTWKKIYFEKLENGNKKCFFIKFKVHFLEPIFFKTQLTWYEVLALKYQRNLSLPFTITSANTLFNSLVCKQFFNQDLTLFLLVFCFVVFLEYRCPIINKLDTWLFSLEFIFLVIVRGSFFFSEAPICTCLMKISQYSQEKTCAGVYFLIKLQTFRTATLLKRDSNIAVFLCILRNF